MKKLFKKFAATLAAIAVLAAPSALLVPAVASAQSSISDSVCTGVLKTSGEAGTASASDCQEESGNTFGDLAVKIINVFSIVVGSVSVIMIIIGGFRYIVSGGSSDGVQGGKNTILYAIIGLVIVLFAQVIVRFVLTQVTSSS